MNDESESDFLCCLEAGRCDRDDSWPEANDAYPFGAALLADQFEGVRRPSRWLKYLLALRVALKAWIQRESN